MVRCIVFFFKEFLSISSVQELHILVTSKKKILSNPVASNHYNSKLKVLCAHPVRTPVFYQSGSPYEDGVLSFSLSRFAGADCRAAHVMTRTVIHHGKMDVLIDEQNSSSYLDFNLKVRVIKHKNHSKL